MTLEHNEQEHEQEVLTEEELDDIAHQEDGAASEPQAKDDAQPEHTNPTVVVAEDESVNRMDLVAMLEDNGYDVVGQAANGEEAIALTRELRPDVVCMDVKMPHVNRMDLVAMLEDNGYDVVGQAANGEEAIALTRELRPDVVCMDVKMPHMDGITAAGVICDENIAPVVMLTAFSQTDLVKQAIGAGAMAYVTKPYEESKLLPALAVAMGRFAEINDLLDSVERNETELQATQEKLKDAEEKLKKTQDTLEERVAMGRFAEINDLLDSVERNETELQATQEKLKDAEEKLKKTQDTLEERKLVDRAKGLLMDKANFSEQGAFRWIQKTSMDQRIPKKRLAMAIIEKYGDDAANDD